MKMRKSGHGFLGLRMFSEKSEKAMAVMGVKSGEKMETKLGLKKEKMKNKRISLFSIFSMEKRKHPFIFFVFFFLIFPIFLLFFQKNRKN